MGLMLRFKKKNKETHRRAGVWSNHMFISGAQTQEKILTLLLMRQSGDSGARRAKECKKTNKQKSAPQRPHQHVLRYVARHGFFSALLMPMKVLLVGFEYTEGAQPLTFVPAHKHNIQKIC